MTDVIVRQTDDLRRIVDEFSASPGCPSPTARRTDLVRWCATRSRCRRPAAGRVAITADLPDDDLPMATWTTMIGQA